MGSMSAGCRRGFVAVRPAAQRRIAGDLAFTGDAGMLHVHRIDQSYVPLDPLAFPAHLVHGIIAELRAALNHCVVFQPQQRVRAQSDGACQIGAGGNQHLAAAQHPTAVHRLLDSGGVLRCAVALSAEIADVQHQRGFFGRLPGRGFPLLRRFRGRLLRRTVRQGEIRRDAQ